MCKFTPLIFLCIVLQLRTSVRAVPVRTEQRVWTAPTPTRATVGRGSAGATVTEVTTNTPSEAGFHEQVHLII
jgi:hypothetical protein